MPNPAINQATTYANIPCFVPVGVLWYTKDTQTLYIGTGISDNGGSPGVVEVGAGGATVDLTAQSAAITATTLYAVPAAGAGMYRITWVATITTKDASSSALGGTNGFQISFTSPTDSVVKTDSPTTPIISAANTTGTSISGCEVVYAKASTNIQYAFGYTSNTPGQMVYELHIKCEAM